MPGATECSILRVTATELQNARFAAKKIAFIATRGFSTPRATRCRRGVTLSRGPAHPAKTLDRQQDHEPPLLQGGGRRNECAPVPVSADRLRGVPEVSVDSSEWRRGAAVF